jgi:hypothetical protein
MDIKFLSFLGGVCEGPISELEGIVGGALLLCRERIDSDDLSVNKKGSAVDAMNADDSVACS